MTSTRSFFDEPFRTIVGNFSRHFGAEGVAWIDFLAARSPGSYTESGCQTAEDPVRTYAEGAVQAIPPKIPLLTVFTLTRTISVSKQTAQVTTPHTVSAGSTVSLPMPPLQPPRHLRPRTPDLRHAHKRRQRHRTNP